MEDKLLNTLFLDTKRWEKALEHGLDKSMNRADLYKYSKKEERLRMYKEIRDGRYNIMPPHIQRIPKDVKGEYREVYINENRDRVLLAISNSLLFEMCPDMVHPSCKSYQTGIGYGKVVQECSRIIAKADGKVIGFKSDFSKYFDSVPIEVIDSTFDKIEERTGKSALIDVFRRYYHQNICFNADHVPERRYMSLMQGCAIAAFLADAVLYDLDARMSSLGGFYVRYSDDCLYIGENYEEAMAVMHEELAKFGLTLNPKKVEYLDSNHWFKFLGFSIRGSEISISKNRLANFEREIKSRTTKKRNASYSSALRSVQRYMYYGDGEHSWASGILPIINNSHDIDELNKYVMDSLRAVQTKKTKIGGLGYLKEGKTGVVIRGTGRNVTANRGKTDITLDGYHSIGQMRNALLYSRDLYDTIVRSEIM